MSKTLLLGNKSVSEWCGLCETTHLARFERLMDQADSYLKWLPPAEHPSESITYIGMAVANLAFAFLLTGTARYLDAARRWMGVAINYPHWGKERFPDHDLDAAWLLFGLGLAYDWIGDDLPPEEREALHNKLMLQGTRLYDFAVEHKGRWWCSAYWQNHNWICYAGLATAAYALVGEHPEVGAWSDRALENLRIVMRSLPEDDEDAAARWRKAAEDITVSLWENYSSRGIDIPAILLHGTRSVPHSYADQALIYGDYYFLETLTKLLRPDIAARAFPAPKVQSIT